MRKKIIIWPKMEHLKPKWEKVNEDVKKGSCVATLCPISSLLLTDDNTKKQTSTFVKTSMRSASSFSFLFQWQILLLLLLPTCLWLYVWLTDLLTSLPVHFRSVDGHLFIIIITCFTTFSQLRWEKKKAIAISKCTASFGAQKPFYLLGNEEKCKLLLSHCCCSCCCSSKFHHH